MVSGAGYVTMKPQVGAHATVRQLLDHPEQGWLASASSVVSLRSKGEVRYALLQRSADAQIGPNLWQFPAGRCSPDEYPLMTACRELHEEIGISGEVSAWSDLEIRVGGFPVTYLTEKGIHRFKARWALHGNVLEFYYPMALTVTSFDAVQLFDNEPYARRVELVSPEELLSLYGTGRLSDGAHAVVQAMLATGELRVLEQSVVAR